MNIDGYTLTEKMRKARRRFRFTATEQALFYELVAICNGEDWRDVFDCSNIELCFALNVNEKTLIKARESLINAGLIYYKSGKNKRIISSYSFVKEFKTTVTTTVNFTANQTANKGANQTANDTVDKGANDTGDSTDYNKLKQKPNRNILSKVSHGDFDFISDEFLEAFSLWLEYKKDRRENYKSEKSLKACYNKLVKLSKNDPVIAEQIVNESIANNWSGLFELKNDKCEYGNKKQTDPEWFKACCKYVCPNFKIDDSNRNIMNQLFLYTEGRSEKLDSNKGLLLRGDIGTGKSTIMQILNRYSYFTRGKAKGGYPIGGFRIDSTSCIANGFSMRGKDALELYTYNNGTPRMICFDELGREPIPAKYFGTELNVMQYIFQCRYELRHEAITHVTTNLTIKEIQRIYGAYIADRINEMFNVLDLNGASRR